VTRVVAVLGYSRGRGGRLHPICAARLSHAERVVGDASAVILSGWARRWSRGAPEAELMRAAWGGPDVLIVCDPDARTTADNAANVAAAALRLDADELVAVTSRWHRPRVRVLLRSALRGTGIRVVVEAGDGPAPLPVLAREAVCVVALPLQLRRARRPHRPVSPG
jgi:uncharacterized SAM-binding protein YcdF (DUF218 family)